MGGSRTGPAPRGARLTAADTPRLTAAAALAATALLALAWLGPQAFRAGPGPAAALLAALAPLALGVRGLLAARAHTGRWLSLALPFYGAGFLVGAFGVGQSRGWAAAGAFCVALGFAATLSWLKQAGRPAPPRSRT
jgi:uncharacterized membrane protein